MPSSQVKQENMFSLSINASTFQGRIPATFQRRTPVLILISALSYTALLCPFLQEINAISPIDGDSHASYGHGAGQNGEQSRRLGATVPGDEGKAVSFIDLENKSKAVTEIMEKGHLKGTGDEETDGAGNEVSGGVIFSGGWGIDESSFGKKEDVRGIVIVWGDFFGWYGKNGEGMVWRFIVKVDWNFGIFCLGF